MAELNLEAILKIDRGRGRVMLGEQRMLLLRQQSLQYLAELLSQQLGGSLTRSLLTQFGFRCGSGDLAAVRAAQDWKSEQDLLRACCELQSLMGLAAAEVEKAVCDRESGEFRLAGVLKTPSDDIGNGACTHGGCNVAIGYISGWCSALYGEPVVAVAIDSDEENGPRRFEARPRTAWGDEAEPWIRALDETEYSLSRELERKLAVIEEQEAAISELSTPVMEIWDDILLLPIVGVVDTRRSMEIMNNLLDSIASTQARCVIIDVTGVEVVDTRTADYLLKVIRAASLLGCRGVLTGLGAAISQTLVEIGADLSEVRTLRSIKEGLRDSLKFLKLPGRSSS